MELKIWIWLLIIVGSFVANMLKKRRLSSLPKPPATGKPDLPAGHHPMTFEDLLREIEGSKKMPKAPFSERAGAPVEQATAWEPVEKPYDYRDHDTIYSIYENAKKEAFSRPSLEETMRLKDTDMKFGAFKGYQRRQGNGFAAEFVNELRKPSGFKHAFVMSEIIQRRF